MVECRVGDARSADEATGRDELRIDSQDVVVQSYRSAGADEVRLPERTRGRLQRWRHGRPVDRLRGIAARAAARRLYGDGIQFREGESRIGAGQPIVRSAVLLVGQRHADL